ncbi:MAG: riboflavin synthase [Streptosporangiales bacterium]|nr:riboflavin synthase [Streptosporangiales bacterium]
MFTGIVEELGHVRVLDRLPGGSARLTVHGPTVTSDARPGDSIAVDGVCLTVTELAGDECTFDVMGETLARSTVGGFEPGRPVDLERALRADQRLGGHIVQGHVDGTTTVLARREESEWTAVTFALPPDLARYVAAKGSIALDGVSLTVVDITTDAFTVGLIPETLRRTVLGAKQPGEALNVEVDVIAKYVERLTLAERQVTEPAGLVR